MRTMRHDPNERVTQELGIEMCKRKGLKAVVVPEIAAFGSKYLITLEAIDARNEKTIARQQEEADSKDKVVAALGKAASGLRRQFGRKPGFSREIQRSSGSCNDKLTRGATSLQGGADTISFGKAA